MKCLAAVVALALPAVAATTDPIVIKGSKFFHQHSGAQFFLKGVAYQPDSANSTNSLTDPLADEAGCARDIPYLRNLTTNTVRVYSIDANANHSGCLSRLADAGIYVLADLAAPRDSLNRDDPRWTVSLLQRYTSVVDSLASYPNVLGFFAGNEVTNNASNTDASAFVKAAVRDVKAYIKQKSFSHPLYVGYAASNGMTASIRDDVEDYLNCGSTNDSIDFFGYNVYSWCGDSSFTKSHYNTIVERFSNYSVPMFFAEYGCNNPEPRRFSSVPTLYGDKMTPVVNGGIVYEYFQQANNYGLVSVQGSSVSPLPDYTRFSSQIVQATPSASKMSDYTPSHASLAACPATGSASSDWHAVASPLPPAADASKCSCKVASLSCIAKKDVTDRELGSLFNYIYSSPDSSKLTADISANATSGRYGDYSMCNNRDQLSIAFDAYYKANGQSSRACDFQGHATTQKSASSSGCASSSSASSSSSGQSKHHGKDSAAALNVPLSSLALYVAAGLFAGAMTVL